jgi:hypothetical protein
MLMVSACAPAASPPQRPALAALLTETKFLPHGNYTGADTPEDLKPLQQAVNQAIEDVSTMPEPMDKEVVRSRLSKLLSDTDLFATEDRDEVGRYAIRTWRAAGFMDETGLFPVADDKVLEQP